MLTDAEFVAEGARLEADVCIVGAGPAGIAVAQELAGSGARVLLLEGGGVGVEPASQRLADGDSVGLPYFALRHTRLRAFGGTSNHWYSEAGFRVRPLDPIDFVQRNEIPHSGWPFGREELDPYYERAAAMLGLRPLGYDLREPDESLGVLELGDSDVVTVLFQVIPGKGVSHHLTALRASSTVTVMTHATVTELGSTGDPRVVSHAEVARPDGRRFTVAGRVFVVAGGGIENARLLLLSNRSQRRGLGNSEGLVGRYFMEHLGVRCGTLVAQSPDLLSRTRLYRGQEVGGSTLHGKLSLSENVLRCEGLLNSTFFLEHLPSARTTQAVRSFVVLRRALTWRPRPPDLGRHLRHALAGMPSVLRTAIAEGLHVARGAESIQLKAMTEQAPNPDSRVTLSDRVDDFGLPMARLDWRLTDLDLHSIKRAEEIIDQRLRAAGVGYLRDPLYADGQQWQISGQWHHMGTTRMHRDARLGVVDTQARLHDADNVYIAGSSVFPTGGYANPTLTLVALAARLGAHLRDVVLPQAPALPNARLS